MNEIEKKHVKSDEFKKLEVLHKLQELKWKKNILYFGYGLALFVFYIVLVISEQK